MYLRQSRLALPFAFLTIAVCTLHSQPKSYFNKEERDLTINNGASH